MTKKQVMGMDLFSSPNQLYKKGLLEIDGKSIWVRELDTQSLIAYKEAGDRLSADYENKVLSVEQVADKTGDITARLILACLCDEEGNLIGTEENFEAVRNFPRRIQNAIVGKAFTLSGINYKEVEEVAANLKNEGID